MDGCIENCKVADFVIYHALALAIEKTITVLAAI